MPATFINFEEQRDLRECRAMLRGGSRTFLSASRFLPSDVANAACALYAFCRCADDLVDAVDANASALEGMRDRLQLIYLGRPIDAAPDRAFARVVVRYDIPRALPDALLDGFAWDAAGRRYNSLAELHDYAARVAGTVGAMMALIMGVRGSDALSQACDLGVAMQLSNIARDVGEDARMGRLYLPREWLFEAGIDESRWLAEPVFDQRLAGVVKKLLAEADRLYRNAAPGISALPRSCRGSIEIARVLYREIGQQVARQGFDSVSRRARVSALRKLGTAAPAMLALLARRRDDQQQPLPANQFLIKAVGDSTALKEPLAPVVSRTEWLIELFERLEHRDRAARAF